jgi:hypothetical protein
MKLPKFLPHSGLLLLGVILLFVPLFLTLNWGPCLDDPAFHTYHAARMLASDVAPTYDLGPLTRAPLYVGLLFIARSYTAQIGLLFSALGWSAAAFLILLTLRAAGRPLAAIISALLLVFNPLVVTTAGSEYSWVLALGWAALALSVSPLSSWENPHRMVWLKALFLLLLLGIHFTVATLLFALTLLAIDIYKERVGWLPFLLLATIAILWGILLFPRSGIPASEDPALWLRDIISFLSLRELNWLYAPFILAGGWDVWRWEVADDESAPQLRPAQGQKLFILLLLWLAVTALSRSPFTPLLLSVLAIILSGLGVAWLSRRVLASNVLALNQRQAAYLLPPLFMIPLLLVAIINLWELYNRRPVMHAELQAQAAAWLEDNAEPAATLYAAPRVAFLARRSTIPAFMDQIRDANITAVYEPLLNNPPDYVVSENNLAWDYITHNTWFKDRYRARARFQHGYAPASPLTVWEYTPSPYDLGKQEQVQATVNDQFALVGYQFEPQAFTPGESIFLTLYLQALQPVANGFVTAVHLTSPDGRVWAWREERTPRSLPGQWWQAGQIIPERIQLQTTTDLPYGAYELQVFWQPGDDTVHWPVYRDGDDNALDRVFLGYVIAPLAVDSSQATPVKAQFGDTIILDAFEFSQAEAGEPWEVTLLWDSLKPPDQDFTVFVHLLDEKGQIVAAHDGMPMENRFPTRAWKQGQIIGDRHRLDLPAGLEAGSYQVNVGMYLLETGERLPVWDADGVEQADRVYPLATVELGSQ